MVFNLLSQYFPYLPTAGRYSLKIQAGVDKRGKDDKRNRFSEALTDADLSIQTFFEVVSLAHNPETLFLGEEYRDSYNDKYFNRNSEYQVFIDPIDGTLPYQENSPRYSIIITITRLGIIEAAIIYVPAEQRGFYAIRGEGAFEISDQELVTQQRGRAFKISKHEKGWVDVSWNSTIRERLKNGNLNMLPEARDWDLRHPFATATRNLTGEIHATVYQNAQLIDGAASAFIASEAGGLVSDFSGNSIAKFEMLPTATVPELVWAIDAEMQAKILALLAVESK